MKKWYSVSLLVLMIDRVTKYWVQKTLQQTGTMQLWPGVVGLRYARNTGVAFSIGAGNGSVMTVLTVVLIFILLSVHFFGKSLPDLTRGSLSLIAAGGIGNAADRLIYHYVIDFIELQFVSFALFNFADMAICIGTGLAIIGLVKKERSNHVVDY